jgi:hypothetical protein
VLADTAQIAVARDLAPSVTLLAERYAEFDEQAIWCVLVVAFPLAPVIAVPRHPIFNDLPRVPRDPLLNDVPRLPRYPRLIAIVGASHTRAHSQGGEA